MIPKSELISEDLMRKIKVLQRPSRVRSHSMSAPFRLHDDGVDLFVRLTPKAAMDRLEGIETVGRRAKPS
jgi:hypothetical protein